MTPSIRVCSRLLVWVESLGLMVVVFLSVLIQQQQEVFVVSKG